MTSTDPPPYENNMASEEATPSGFPTGYFVIRNLAAGRLLDVVRSSSQDGAEVVLWEDKDRSRVFFVDHNGALCSKASGHAIDIERGIPVLRHRKPFTSVPTAESHPLPRITYVAKSKSIRVTFDSDPNYPPPDSSDPAKSWRSKGYILSAVPVCKQPSFFDNALGMVSALSTSFAKPQTLVSDPHTSGSASASQFGLRDDEVMEEERTGKEDEADDSPELGRPVHMLELPIAYLEKEQPDLSDEARLRRQWEVIRILDHKRRTGHRES